MGRRALLKDEMKDTIWDGMNIRNYLLYQGYQNHFDDPIPIAKAYAIESLFLGHEKHVYHNDLIAGSVKGLLSDSIDSKALDYANRIANSYGFNTFITNSDHFAPDYEGFLSDGVGGTLEKIAAAKSKYQEEKKVIFLTSAEITMKAFGKMIEGYGEAAKMRAEEGADDSQRTNLLRISQICGKISHNRPESFHEALQLVWLAHISFLYEGRYAMALGRMDQYLWPFYKRDIENGTLTPQVALELIECTLYKIGEHVHLGGDDVVNIAIGGVRRDGTNAVNPLSYLILEAVKNCQIPGPNLSARIHSEVSDEFLDECLKVIGTGLGYPALMNDEVNIPALARYGYDIEDCRDYSMVGCIENFITGKQPPWSDGRYNIPKYIELALNNGRCMLTGVKMGPDTGDVSTFKTMEAFLDALKEQMAHGAAEYMMFFRNENNRYNKEQYTQPHLSCFCRDCIDRGLDINDGGTIYPSVHGVGCMGIATFADSLAAIEEVVFDKKLISLSQLQRALQANFKGYEDVRAYLMKAPKYGNNDDMVDKYAVWYVAFVSELFSKYKTPDGGGVYIAIASNVANIPAGKEVAATPDGRNAGMPLSDAASPMAGADEKGPTAVVHSVTKPDYTLAACGTVLNQKFSPETLEDDEKRAKMLALIRIYFKKGGQEIQINSVSRKILIDAMENPQNYRNLVIRVSGFSAFFVSLDREVQLDILNRTEHA